MHELTRVRAYARLIVAIAGDTEGSWEATTRAIDTIVSRMIDTTPEDIAHKCANRPFVYCDACASA